MLRTFAIAGTLAATVLVAPALGHTPWQRPAIEVAPLEARGCYYYRGEEYCGSYCYWEFNGKRYCQKRAREAFPQADVYLEDPIIETAPSRRRRHTIK